MAYTTIDDPSAYFQTKIYSGDGNDDRNITYDGNSDMQPDWLWFKRRNQVVNHILFDSTRGVNKRFHTNNTNAEATEANFLQAFNSNGFQVGTDADINGSGGTYVSWGWKANGGTTSSNTDGTITSTVQADTTAGFSIVTYTGTGSNATIGHGLGSTPQWYFVKNRSNSTVSTVDQSWVVYHSFMAQGAAMFLNTTDSKINNPPFWNSTAPTSTTFSVGTDTRTNNSGDNFIAYCFAEKQGYSKFGSFTGNGNADGPFIYTGFKPAWVMQKNISTSTVWFMWDNKRDTFNQANHTLEANSSGAESSDDTGATNHIDIVSNGYKIRNTGSHLNNSGQNYIYMAFASSPFVSSEGVPTTAR